MSYKTLLVVNRRMDDSLRVAPPQSVGHSVIESTEAAVDRAAPDMTCHPAN